MCGKFMVSITRYFKPDAYLGSLGSWHTICSDVRICDISRLPYTYSGVPNSEGGEYYFFEIFDPPILLKMPPHTKNFSRRGDPPHTICTPHTIRHRFLKMLKSVRVDVERWGLEQ